MVAIVSVDPFGDRWRYSPTTLERARERFSHKRLSERFGRRIGDLVAGAPSRDQPPD